MFAPKSHYLSYGSTDQETARQAVGQYSGILVPGTIAAYQSEGTSGFISSFVSAHPQTSYSIDPRFPLFQQALMRVNKNGELSAKAAHRALASLLGDDDLITGIAPQPEDFSGERLTNLVKRWHHFQTEYTDSQPSKFDKYAERLGESVVVEHRPTPPSPLIPLYFVDLPQEPAWKAKSDALFSEALSLSEDYVPVLASGDLYSFEKRIRQEGPQRACIWLSGFDELTRTSTELRRYAGAIRDASGSGRQLFALYGGFFHVLLTTLGLRGASHGVGYGEHRAWEELPSSGGPPTRLYVPLFHRYITPELADTLFDMAPELVRCVCVGYEDIRPSEVPYHKLMEHSVICRQREYIDWSHLDPAEAVERLRTEVKQVEETCERFDQLAVPDRQKLLMRNSVQHLPRWLAGFEAAITEEVGA